ncbi:MAG TPA: phage tail tape measure protein [Actinophytocola sp.]|jgi:hypothetical protein|nr:phage tail tape measure protein [Actinophytocola sp.]
MSNEIQVVVKSKDLSKLDKVGDDAKRAGKEIGTGLEKGFKEGEQAGERSTSSIRKSLGKLTDAGKEAGKGMGEGITGSLGEVGKVAGIAAAGALIGDQLMQGLERQFEEQKVGGLIAAQTGQASSAAGQLGETAGAVFYDNFGESIEQVGEAMTAAFQNKLIDTSASQEEIKKVTESVITLGQVSGESFNELSRSASQMVKTGLAGNVTEAMDLIDHAVDKGLNSSEDLLDTVTEYGTKFRGLGLNGQEAFGLISQAMDAGARDTDTAADALKEFQIRAQDMSVTTTRGFETVGLNAGKMGDMIAAGGKPAKEALRQTLNALQSMPPSVERSQAAVDLFGTKAEDLGDALYSMDLDDAAEQFGDFAGSVGEDMDTISATTPIVEQWGKNFQKVLDGIGDGFEGARAGFNNFMDGLSGVEGGNEAALAAINNLGDSTDDETEKSKENAEQHKETSTEIRTHVQSLDELIAAQMEAAGVVLNERDALRDYRKSVSEATDAVDKHKAVSDDEAEKLDNVAKTALDAADAMNKNGRSTDEVNKVVNNARARFIALAQKMGYSRDEAINLANSLKLIPRKVDTTVVLRAQAARANLDAYQRALNNLHDKTVTVTTYVRGANITGSGGHQFLSQARGGISTTIGHAAEGGAHSGTTLINEAGPEAVKLPNGSTVMTAGATRALAERGLLGDVGVLETAATGGARGRGVPAYQRSGQVNVAQGQHSAQFIQNLISQGWRAMDGDMSRLFAPWLQDRAGARRRFSSPHVVASGGHGGILESGQRTQPITGTAAAPEVGVHVSGDADQAVGAMINRLVRDGLIKVTVRS